MLKSRQFIILLYIYIYIYVYIYEKITLLLRCDISFTYLPSILFFGSFLMAAQHLPWKEMERIRMYKIIYYYFFGSLLRVFPTSISRWCLTGVWVTTSLLKSPRLFSVFWPISVMQWFGWSPLVQSFLSSPVLGLIFGGLTKSISHDRCYRHFHVPKHFQFPSKVELLIPLFTFF